MRTTLQTQLRIPADGRFLPLVQNYVRELAHTVGLSERDILALELAAEEAFQNISDHAYPDGAPGDVLVSAELLKSELRLSFQDEGLPFDPALLARPGARPASETTGLGLKLIHNAVDEALWVNRGKQGKVLCLVKRLPQVEEVAEDRSDEGAKLPRAPEQEYEVRPLRQDEALQVARLFWLTYGFSYKSEAFYRPEGLLDMVDRGTLVSYVAVTGDGEVVGHAALLRPEPVPMAEMAMLVVSPAHRGRGLMERFTSSLTERAGELGLFGVSFNPVTSHTVSQKQTISSMGARPSGLDLAACPPRLFKGMRLEETPPRRESYIHCFKYLTPPTPATAYVPERHRGMVSAIYEHLGRVLTLPPAAETNGPGAYSVSFDRGLSKGVVRVTQADGRQWPEIRRAALDLLDLARAEVVHIDLPLAQAATSDLCEKAESAGFFFAGVWPHAAGDGDMLRLTRLAASLDLTLLRLHSDFSRELAGYVGGEMARAMGDGKTEGR